jgi:hypothetical protein
MTGESRTRLVARCQYLAVETFDGHAIRSISGPEVRSSEACEPQELIPGAAVYDHVVKSVSFALVRQQHAVNRHAGRKAAELPP